MKWLVSAIAVGLIGVVGYVAFPTDSQLPNPSPLVDWDSTASPTGQYTIDFSLLRIGFRAQRYRSFCGPATLATVLRAYGANGIDQRSLFPTIGSKANAFFTGLTLAELATLARSTGLDVDLVYADTLSAETFRTTLMQNLATEGDYILVNYDRRRLNQSGAGHISAIGAYSAQTDAFLVLDQASYKYPFTWIPTQLLFDATNTQDGDHHRGILIVRNYTPGS